MFQVTGGIKSAGISPSTHVTLKDICISAPYVYILIAEKSKYALLKLFGFVLTKSAGERLTQAESDSLLRTDFRTYQDNQNLSIQHQPSHRLENIPMSVTIMYMVENTRTKREVDDNVVGTETLGKVALIIHPNCSGLTL